MLAAVVGAGGLLASAALWPESNVSDGAIALAVYAVATVVAGLALHRDYPHSRLGLCNLTTLARLVMVCVLLLPLLASGGASWTVFAIAVTALALDGVDGWLARRQGLVSRFGAWFDMEVDSAFGLVLALNAGLGGNAGPWAILLGLPRYVFGAAGLLFPWLRRELPERFGRKTVCVLQLGTLIVLQAPAVPGWVSVTLVTASTAGLAWSFGRDIRWLWAARS